MTEKLRIGIAGYGVVGKRRRQYIDLHPSLKTVVICDRIFEGNGILEDGVHYYSQYKEMLSENLDALFVCLSNDVAADVTIAGLENV